MLDVGCGLRAITPLWLYHPPSNRYMVIDVLRFEKCPYSIYPQRGIDFD